MAKKLMRFYAWDAPRDGNLKYRFLVLDALAEDGEKCVCKCRDPEIAKSICRLLNEKSNPFK